MRSAARPVTAFITALAVLSLGASARAQGAPEAEATESLPADPQASVQRTLNGHTFIPSELVRTPFTATSVGSLTGFGYANVRVTPPNGAPVNYQLGQLALGFDAQFGLTPWWSVRVAGSGQALAGVNLATVLDIGASVGYAGQAGTTFSFVHRDRVRMGLSIDAQYQPQYNINIIDALTNSIMAGRVTASTLLTNTQELQVSAAWQMAASPHRLLGFFTEFRYAHAFSKRNDDPTNYGLFQAGVGLSVDFHAVSALPFGVLGAYRATGDVRRGSEITHDVSAGVFYTGRRSLVLGAEAALTLIPASANVQYFIAQAVFLLRHYW